MARLEDLGVAAEPRDLVLERLKLVAVGERIAEQVAQARDEPARLARVLGDEAGNGVEGIEKEVRLELGAQARELGGGLQLVGLDAKLIGLERAKPRVLGDVRENEGERP